MKVICFEDKAFYALIEELFRRFKNEPQSSESQWIPETDAKRLLNIKSKTTLQRLRDEGKIRYSQPQKKIILYDRHSINAYLDKNAYETF